MIPINPRGDEALGERCFPSLDDVPHDAGVEVVNIFRRPEDACRHVDEAIGAKAVWMQRGIVDEKPRNARGMRDPKWSWTGPRGPS